MMAPPRPLESSAFVLVLGTLLANHGVIEAVHFQPHHVSEAVGPVHRTAGAAAGAGGSITEELAPCERSTAAAARTTPTRGEVQQQSLGMRIATVLRGGRSTLQRHGGDEEIEYQEDDEEDEGALEEEEEEEGGEEEEEVVPYDEKDVEWMMQQLCMYQTRVALISNPLAAKGYKLKEIVPSPRGLICAISTEERRMDCRMYVEAEVGKKVVAPCKCKGTQKWISFSALNSERRKEPVKWKNCPTCQGPIDYKLYEAYGGGAGKAVSAVLNNSRATRMAIGLVAGVVALIVSPVVHAVMVRILTSGVFWKNYHRLTFIVHLPLPLQIMGIRFLMKWSGEQLMLLENIVRESLTDVESQILESRLPVTIDVGKDGEEVAVPYQRP
eukprot:g5535.t1